MFSSQEFEYICHLAVNGFGLCLCDRCDRRFFCDRFGNSRFGGTRARQRRRGEEKVSGCRGRDDTRTSLRNQRTLHTRQIYPSIPFLCRTGNIQAGTTTARSYKSRRSLAFPTVVVVVTLKPKNEQEEKSLRVRHRNVPIH
jgi:hypothetical protein